jgi:hypothetical protein
MKNLLEIFHREIMFVSANGKSNINHPGILVSEVHKMSGIAKVEVIGLFKKLIEMEFLEKVIEQEYSFRVKKMMTINELEQRLNEIN